MASSLLSLAETLEGCAYSSRILRSQYPQKEENDCAPELGQSFSEGVSAEAAEDGAAREGKGLEIPTKSSFLRRRESSQPSLGQTRLWMPIFMGMTDVGRTR